MHARDRTKLLAGPYRTPRCKIGGALRCAMRGKVVVCGIHEAPIQWPYTLRKKGGGRPMLILCGDLARAVQHESETAIGTMKDRDVAARTGRSEESVSARRYVRCVPAFTKRKPRSQPMFRNLAKDRLLGTMSDVDLARQLRCTPTSVFNRRRRLKIAAYSG